MDARRPGRRLFIYLSPLLLIMILAMAAISAVHMRRIYFDTIGDAREDALQVARHASAELAGLMKEAHVILKSALSSQVVREGDVASCQMALAEVQAGFPEIANIVVLAKTGQPLCSALPLGEKVSVGEAPWFQEAVTTGEPQVRGYQEGYGSESPVIPFAFPSLDVDGEVERVAVALIDVPWIEEAMQEVHLYEEWTLTVFDSNGTVVTRIPIEGGWQGYRWEGALDILPLPSTSDEESLFETVDLDGKQKLIASRALANIDGGDLFVSIATPLDVAYQGIARDLRRDAILLGLASVAAFGLGALGLLRMVIQPLAGIREVAERIRAGDYGARAALVAAPAEIGALGQAIDEMAASLEDHHTTLAESLKNEKLHRERLQAVLHGAPVIIYSVDQNGRIAYIEGKRLSAAGLDPEDLVGRDFRELLGQDGDRGERFEQALKGELSFSEIRFGGRIFEACYAPRFGPEGEPLGIVGVALDVSEKALADEARRKAEARFAAILQSAPDAIITIDRDQRIIAFNQGAAALFGYDAEEVLGKPLDMLLPEAARGRHADHVRRFQAGEEAWRRMAEDRQIFARRKDGSLFPAEVSLSRLELDGEIALTAILRDISKQKAAQDKVQQQVQRLDALRAIDMAITSSLDLRVTLHVFLDQVVSILEADAADVLLMDPHTHQLRFAAGRGFQTNALQYTQLPIGGGHAGRAALERKTIIISNLQEEIGDLKRSSRLEEEGFSSYIAVALIAKAQVRGVLELFFRRPFEPESEWMDFLEALAAQASIAMDNATMMEDLRTAHDKLSVAYDSTLEGWSRALDLRDKETEGHTQRVTDITVRIARAMGLPSEDIVHLRRGALLHDIGKMGIPDAILLKPGALSEEEWEIMRKHPTMAYEMLAPIEYLRRALDIPYCHHEKWDGSGYPRGLKQEQIPIAARIFAVADVWDALCSDRPYRAAWSPEKSLQYIESESGKHFDPQAVRIFMELVPGLPSPPASASA